MYGFNMVKRHTTLSIEDDLMKKAKDKFINVSDVLEDAIKKKLNIVEVIKSDKCEFCGREERPATAENPIGLTWLCPDEMWICSECLNSKIKKIIHGKNG